MVSWRASRISETSAVCFLPMLTECDIFFFPEQMKRKIYSTKGFIIELKTILAGDFDTARRPRRILMDWFSWLFETAYRDVTLPGLLNMTFLWLYETDYQYLLNMIVNIEKIGSLTFWWLNGWVIETCFQLTVEIKCMTNLYYSWLVHKWRGRENPNSSKTNWQAWGALRLGK